MAFRHLEEPGLDRQLIGGRWAGIGQTQRTRGTLVRGKENGQRNPGSGLQDFTWRAGDATTARRDTRVRIRL